jgi:hypothetical protein
MIEQQPIPLSNVIQSSSVGEAPPPIQMADVPVDVEHVEIVISPETASNTTVTATIPPNISTSISQSTSMSSLPSNMTPYSRRSTLNLLQLFRSNNDTLLERYTQGEKVSAVSANISIVLTFIVPALLWRYIV